ncbi:stage 0 sporulation protein [Candidatus Falkowbacteria bacterium]|nr:stage 0 sporulation protein [Candidatus Falkowbacteria bacterium]
MRLVQVQFVQWDKIYSFNPAGIELDKGNYVIVETKLGIEIGKVVGFLELAETELANLPEPLKPITRKATKQDLDKVLEQRKEKTKMLKVCKRFVEKCKLPMKLVDVHISFDDSRITFAFIANGRIDFRELLKELIKKFQKNIRLQQIGVRDEARLSGDVGCCGMALCCQRFCKEIDSVTSDLADLQQVAHRGVDRLSGVCGRLKCCLNFEKAHYLELSEKLPAVGDTIKVPQGKGEVINRHLLKGTVDVLLEDGETIVETTIK